MGNYAENPNMEHLFTVSIDEFELQVWFGIDKYHYSNLYHVIVREVDGNYHKTFQYETLGKNETEIKITLIKLVDHVIRCSPEMINRNLKNLNGAVLRQIKKESV